MNLFMNSKKQHSQTTFVTSTTVPLNIKYHKLVCIPYLVERSICQIHNCIFPLIIFPHTIVYIYTDTKLITLPCSLVRTGNFHNTYGKIYSERIRYVNKDQKVIQSLPDDYILMIAYGYLDHLLTSIIF